MGVKGTLIKLNQLEENITVKLIKWNKKIHSANTKI